MDEGLTRLKTLKGQLNIDKCHIKESQIALLGHVISSGGIEVDPNKVQALIYMHPPSNARQLISFLQKVRYMGRFIHLLSELVTPL